MRKLTVLFLIICLCGMLSFPVMTQEVGDYQTRNTGNWSNPQVWQIWNGSAWGNINVPPTGEETITILENDSVHVDVSITISGTLVVQGAIGEDSEIVITIADSGVYQHDRDEGRLPLDIVWQEGSTFLITGTVAVPPTNRNQNYHHIVFDTPDLLSNLNMNLNDNIIGGDILVKNTSVARWYLTSALAMDTATVTILGDVIVENGQFSVQGTSNALTTFIVHHYGNVIVTGGNFSVSRGSQGGGTTTWYLYEGNFYMENATTQSSTATPGGAKFVFAGEDEFQVLTIGEGVTMTALPVEVAENAVLHVGESVFSGTGIFTVKEKGTLITSHPGGTAAVFAATMDGEITLEPGSGYGYFGEQPQITSNIIPDELYHMLIWNPAGVTLSKPVNISGTLGIMEGVLDNAISFTFGEGATLGTGHPGGIAAMLETMFTSTPNISSVENYMFFGETPQITSAGMPAVVNDLTIDNTAGVTLSRETTINGVLLLESGVFDNTIPFTLGETGTIEYAGGSLLHDLVSVNPPLSGIPESFFVAQNYPNPFNPSTIIRFGLPSHSRVQVAVYNLLGQLVSNVFEGDLNAGVHELTFDASTLSSGVYLYRIQAGESVSTKQMMLIK